jgi:hypothetical protein
MIVMHTMDQILALHSHLEAAGVMRTIGKAIFGLFAAIFVVGGLLGFFIGKAFGGRR